MSLIKRTSSKTFLYNAALTLLSLACVLNLFAPRFATEETSFIRLPIQLTYGLLLILMMNSVFTYQNKKLHKVLTFLRLILLTIILYLMYSFAIGTVPGSSMSPYLRSMLWLASIIFFMANFRHADSRSGFLLKTLVLLFLIVTAKRMFEIISEKDVRLGGDTSGLTLVLIIPAILLFFKGNLKTFLIVTTILLIFISIRRTAILALLVTFPFLLKDLKSKLKSYHIFFFVILLICSTMYAWEYLGSTIIYRFENLFVGDSGGSKESFGSGRSDFYRLVLVSWSESTLPNLLFGHGAGSVRELLAIEYHDIGHSHNDYLEILYTFGLWGLTIWLFFLFNLYKMKKAIKYYIPERINIFYIGVLSLIIISLVSGTFFKSDMLIFSITIGVIFSEVSTQIKKKKQHLIAEKKNLLVN